MVVKAVPLVPIAKFTKEQEKILRELSIRLKSPEVVDKGAEIQGAIRRIDSSSECMATTWTKLNFTAEKLSTSSGSAISRFFRIHKKPILNAELVAELQAQIREEFPMASFIPKPPAAGNDVDILLESLLLGASKHRFFQVGSVEEFLGDIDDIQGKILRSLVTGLRGIANFRDANKSGEYPAEAGSGYSIEEALKLINTMRSMELKSALDFNSEEILSLAKFKSLGLKAFDLLMSKDLCYGDHQTSFKDWGAVSADITNPVNQILKLLQEDLNKIKEQEAAAESELAQAVLAFITSLNAKITEVVGLAMDFEAMRHKMPDELAAAEAQQEAEKADDATARVYEPKDIPAEAGREAAGIIRAKTIKRHPTIKRADSMATKAKERYESIVLDDSGDEDNIPEARRLSFGYKPPEKPEGASGIGVEALGETSAGASAYRLPVGFEYQDGTYIYRGEALSDANKAARAALEIDISQLGKAWCGECFDLYSDGVYRLETDPYYMLVGNRVFSSDLNWELIERKDGEEGTSAAEYQSPFEVIQVEPNTLVQISPGLTLTTPIKIIYD